MFTSKSGYCNPALDRYNAVIMLELRGGNKFVEGAAALAERLPISSGGYPFIDWGAKGALICSADQATVLPGVLTEPFVNLPGFGNGKLNDIRLTIHSGSGVALITADMGYDNDSYGYNRTLHRLIMNGALGSGIGLSVNACPVVASRRGRLKFAEPGDLSRVSAASTNFALRMQRTLLDIIDGSTPGFNVYVGNPNRMVPTAVGMIIPLEPIQRP